MHSLTSPLFWINALYFFLAVILAFFIPGQLLIRKLKLDLFSEIIVSVITGLALWSLLGFMLGFLRLRNVLYLYLCICFVIWIKQKYYSSLKQIFYNTLPPVLTAIVLLGTLIQLSSIWFNGIQVRNGLYFCCGVPDTITHVALTSELVRRFPPNEPGFSTIPLLNYHYLSNLSVADLARVFKLPLIPTQYQYMTILLSLLLGLSAIALARRLQLGGRVTLWFVFFLYFAGDSIFLLSAIAGNGIQFSLTTLENASTLWISPPRFFSLVILLGGLTLFVQWIKKRDIYSGVLMALVLGSLIGFKVYVGMFVLSGFAFLALYYLFTKQYAKLVPIVLLSCISFLIFIPVNKNAGGVFFTGFWRFEDFIVQPVLGLSRLELSRRVYLDHYDFLRAFLYDLLFAFLYIIFSAGTLLLGVFQTKRSKQQLPKDLTIVLGTGLISTCIAGFFFMQETGGANSSQFLISIYIAGALYAGLAISWWTRKLPSVLLFAVSILIICFTSTRVIHDTYVRMEKILNTIGVVIPPEDLSAYQYFAKTEKGSTILVFNDSDLDCLFIPIFGARSTFTCTSGMPGVLSPSLLAERNRIKETVFFEKDPATVKQALSANNISYVSIPKKNVQETTMSTLSLPVVFETDRIAIYKTTGD